MPATITSALVQEAVKGDPRSFAELFSSLYSAWKKKMKGKPNATMSPTAVLHEVYVKLAGRDLSAIGINNIDGLESFVRLVAKQVIIDHHRKSLSGKGFQHDASRDVDHLESHTSEYRLLIKRVQATVEDIKTTSPRAHRCFCLRYLRGLTVSDVAQEMNISERTVKAESSLMRVAIGAAIGEI